MHVRLYAIPGGEGDVLQASVPFTPAEGDGSVSDSSAASQADAAGCPDG